MRTTALAFLLLICAGAFAQGDIGIGLARGAPALRWANTNGVQFQLQRSLSLSPESWEVLASVTADARELRWKDESFRCAAHRGQGDLRVQVQSRAPPNSATVAPR